MLPLKTRDKSELGSWVLGQRGWSSWFIVWEEGSSSLVRLPPSGPRLLYYYITVAIIAK